MLGLYPVADIRAAEEDVMARVPAGSLMARASFGLAVECARLLHEVTGGVAGRRIVVLVAQATTEAMHFSREPNCSGAGRR